MFALICACQNHTENKSLTYQQLKNILDQNGIKTSIKVLGFRPLGTVHEDVRRNLGKLGLSGDEAKTTMKWCSVSNMICGILSDFITSILYCYQ